MAFGKKESYNDDLISYTESVDMILSDLKSIGYIDLTKDKVNQILQDDYFSIGRAVRIEMRRLLNET